MSLDNQQGTILNIFNNLQGDLEKDFSITVRLSSFPISEAVFVKTATEKWAKFSETKDSHLETGWDLGPFAVLVPGQTSQRNRYKETIRVLKRTAHMGSRPKL